jgi:protease I
MGLEGKRVIMVLGPQYQDEEGRKPYEFLKGKGAHVDVVGLQKGNLKGLHGRASMKVNKEFGEVDTDDYDAMVIPGGRGPANLRKHPEPVEFVKGFFETGKTVAAICHGPQVLASAGLLKGKKITGYHKIGREMLSAGADFTDEPVVIDGNLITSREPQDIPIFNQAIEDALT